MSNPREAEVQDPKEKESNSKDPWEDWNKQWHQDYENFKASVDKSIDRDPHGTLFGRHLRSPLSARNSGWTAWAWVFEPKTLDREKINEERRVREEKLLRDLGIGNKAPNDSSSPRMHQPATTSPPIFSVPNKADVYEFDPISMKKIVKSKVSASPTPEEKPFLSSLFSEHGAVDIPVKTFKPHKVYGYGSPATDVKVEPKAQPGDTTRKDQKGVENSRSQEIRKLKASILGNSIDTAAEYGGKYIPKGEGGVDIGSKLEPTPSSYRVFGDEDTAPLFSGTTYQSKADSLIAQASNVKADWLQKEGFQTTPAKSDAVRATPSSRLETALDRHHKAISPEAVNKGQLYESYRKSGVKQRDEDTDLLRASDVRAAARTARHTKQQFASEKRQARHRLSRDFDQRTVRSEEGIELDNASKLTHNLKTAWNHVAQYPKGVVAKTMQSLGFYNSNFKEYVRLDRPVVDLTSKLVFKDESLSKVASIYKKPSTRSTGRIDTFTPSHEVLKADRERLTRTEALQKSTQDAKKQQADIDAATTDLAANIRNAYEEQYGKIDIKHRQTSGGEPSKQTMGTEPEAVPEPVKKLHPLQSASSRPGTELEASFRKHIFEFEPRLIRLREEARSLARSIHESQELLFRHQQMARLSQRLSRGEIARVSKLPTEDQPSGTGTSLDSTIPKTQSSVDMEGSELESAVRRMPIKPVNTLAPASTSPTEPSTTNVQESRPSPAITSRLSLLLQRHDRPTFLFLAYSSDTDAVQISPLSWRMFRKQDLDQARQDIGMAITKLNHPSKYMPYLSPLEAQDYELYRGGQDSLVFKKIDRSGLTVTEQATIGTPTTTAATSTPIQESPKTAADVLDSIPSGNGPQPGPSAPTAPTPSLISNNKPRIIKRQEEVFSGQSLAAGRAGAAAAKADMLQAQMDPKTRALRKEVDNARALTEEARAANQADAKAGQLRTMKRVSDEEVEAASGFIFAGREYHARPARRAHDQKTPTPAAVEERGYEQAWRVRQEQDEQTHTDHGSSIGAKESAWRRFTRGVRRVFLTGIAMAGFAYGIGVVAESVGAQSSSSSRPSSLPASVQRRVIEESGGRGARASAGRARAERPGIYSTESSR